MSKKKKITMQTIADAVGVSVATVSHVINRTRPVEHSLREKIIETMEMLHYSKERSHAQKRKSLTSHIGLIIPNLKDLDLFKYIIQVVETIANENGYTLLLGDSAFSPEKEKELIELFLQKHVSGLILASVLFSPEEIEKNTLFNTIPTVLIDRKWDSNKYDFVGIDNFKSAFDTTCKLIQAGYKSIHFMSLGQPSITLVDREAGYNTAIQSHNLQHQCFTHRINPLHDITQQIALIYEKYNNIDAIICYNTSTFYEIILSLKQLQIHISKNLKIVTYDDVPWFEFLEFPLSVIRQPTAEIGMNAIKLLIDKIEHTQNKEDTGKQILFPTEYIEYRESPAE